MPNWILNGSYGAYTGGPLLTDSNIDVRVSFGDFYYKDANTPSSFGYLVSTASSSGEQIASFQTPAKEVWAREWSHKYVTQFYNDADLTELATGFIGNDNWYTYSALTDQGNPLNTQSGSENSGVSGFDTENTPSLLNGSSIANRRWVAQFDSTGKKIKGTAKPCNSGNLGNY